MRKDCWNCKNDNQNANFPCDYCHTGNIDDFWKPKDEMKDFAIAEFEKIKAEINEYLTVSFADDEDFRWFNLCLDKHISELKGENNDNS